MKIRTWCAGVGITFVCQVAQAQIVRDKVLGFWHENRQIRESVRTTSLVANEPEKASLQLKVGGAYSVDDDDLKTWNIPLGVSYQPAQSRWLVALKTDGYAWGRVEDKVAKKGWNDTSLDFAYTIPKLFGVGLTVTHPSHSDIGTEHGGETASFTSKLVQGSWSFSPRVAWKRKDAASTGGLKNFAYGAIEAECDMGDDRSFIASVERTVAKGEARASALYLGYGFSLAAATKVKGLSASVTLSYNFDGTFRDRAIELQSKGIEVDLTYKF